MPSAEVIDTPFLHHPRGNGQTVLGNAPRISKRPSAALN